MIFLLCNFNTTPECFLFGGQYGFNHTG